MFQQLRSFSRVTFFGSGNKGGNDFEPARDIGSLTGKVILITGGAGDLGRQAAIEFARHDPARIYLADLPRSDQGSEIIAAIHTEVPSASLSFLELDLASFESVQKAAAKFLAAEDRLDICVLNAGILRVKEGVTADGYEISFGINYLGHALLTKLLLPTLLHTAKEVSRADVRVVVVASEGHSMAPRGGIQFDKLKTPCTDMKFYQRYGQSKVACIGLAREIARLYPELKVASIHPGRIITGLAYSLRKESLLVVLLTPVAPLLCTSIAEGVKNHLWAATADIQSGKYYEPVGIPDKETSVAKDSALSKELWEWTEKELQGLD